MSHECLKEQIVEFHSSLSIYFQRMSDKHILHQKLSNTNINFRLRVNHNQKGGIFFCKSIWFLFDFFDSIILSVQLNSIVLLSRIDCKFLEHKSVVNFVLFTQISWKVCFVNLIFSSKFWFDFSCFSSKILSSISLCFQFFSWTPLNFWSPRPFLWDWTPNLQIEILGLSILRLYWNHSRLEKFLKNGENEHWTFNPITSGGGGCWLGSPWRYQPPFHCGWTRV